jgi:hypothetical protein
LEFSFYTIVGYYCYKYISLLKMSGTTSNTTKNSGGGFSVNNGLIAGIWSGGEGGSELRAIKVNEDGSLVVSGGGGGSGADNTPQLLAILAELKDDKQISETVWYDRLNPSLFYIRVRELNQDQGTLSVPTFTNVDGTAANPVIANLVQANSSSDLNPNRTLATASFNKITDGTNTAAVKTTAPLSTDPALVVALSPNTPISTNGLTDAQLRAAPLPSLDVALSTRLKPSDTLAGVTTLGSITNALPTGNNTIGNTNRTLATAGYTVITDGTSQGVIKSTVPAVADNALVVSLGQNSVLTKAVNSSTVNGLITPANTSFQIAAINNNRRAIEIFNRGAAGSATIWLSIGATAAVGQGIPIAPNGSYVSPPNLVSSAIYTLASSTNNQPYTFIEY